MMKKITTFLCLFLLGLAVFAQSSDKKNDNSSDDELTCYQQYARVFEKRGAFNVPDSVYDNVVITFRKQSSTDCFMGKVTVKDGEIQRNNMFLKFSDGTYEKVDYKYKYDFPITIINGKSRTLVTKGGQLIDVWFVSKIKPKKKNYERAPTPHFNLN